VQPSKSERHLYAQLTIQNFPSQNPDAYRPPELHKLIHDNPNIAKYVRTLQINVQATQQYYSFIRAWPLMATGLQELDSILPMLTQLEGISLSSGENKSTSWFYLPESFRTIFTNCLRLPTLTDVRISNIAFPLSVLDSTRSLKSLSLSGDLNYHLSASPIAHPTLDTLILYNCSLLKNIAGWLSTRNLRSLDLKDDDNIGALPSLLKACSDTLTTLKVHVPYHCKYPGYILTIAFQQVMLILFYLVHRRYPLSRNYSEYSMHIPMTFSHACLPPHLARLVFQCSISLTQDFLFDTSHKVPICCSGLPAMLQLLNTFPPLPATVVFLLISINIDIKDSFDDISAVDWSPLISFPFFDVIPRIELRVRAQKGGHQVCSVELLNTLMQDPHLMQLEKYPAFVIAATDSEENL